MPTLGLILLPLFVAYLIILAGDEPSFSFYRNPFFVRHAIIAIAMLYLPSNSLQLVHATMVLSVYVLMCVLMERERYNSKATRSYVASFLLIAGIELAYAGMINYTVAYAISVVVIPGYFLISAAYLLPLYVPCINTTLGAVISSLYVLAVVVLYLRVVKAETSRVLLLSATLQVTILVDLMCSLCYHHLLRRKEKSS
jgi:hypothetical protein